MKIWCAIKETVINASYCRRSDRHSTRRHSLETALVSKLHKAIIGLFTGTLLLVSGGLAIAYGHGDEALALDRHKEFACLRKLDKRTMNGQRDMKITSYRLESPDVGVATGSFQTEFRPGRWTPLAWTCRLHPESGRVYSVEFGWTGGGSRLLAAARLRN